ncbi:hypothetical protein R1flu_010017 [Riccia fluitans]|uniref:non-specific serine/threonine protein kinase n=1 Tax=Riccia fluitans TaxID=41844 RepID=A0ABD1Z3Z0_9MARC
MPNFNQSGVSTAIKGTLGYLDPGYFSRGKLTTKSDIFSFGVVLLETTTGRRPRAVNCPGGMSMVEWVTAADLKDEIDTVVDPALGNRYNREGMRKVVKMALSCIATVGEERPEMRDILRVLMDACDIELGDTPHEKPQKSVKTSHVQWDDEPSSGPTTTTGRTSGFSSTSFREEITKVIGRYVCTSSASAIRQPVLKSHPVLISSPLGTAANFWLKKYRDGASPSLIQVARLLVRYFLASFASYSRS